MLPLGILAALFLLACAGAEPVPDTPATVAGRVVDSTFPIEEEIRRFAATVESLPMALRGGAPDRDALVARLVQAVERRDTLALAPLVVQRDEFISLYYPHTTFTRPPYELSPALVWFQMQNVSSRGISRLLQRDGGGPLGVTGVRCPTPPREEGPNRIWEGCLAIIGAAATERRLFGPILERGGTWKFLTLSNEY